MDITPDLIPSYVEMLRESSEGRMNGPDLERIRAEFTSGGRRWDHTKVRLSPDGGISASIGTEPVDSIRWILTELKLRRDPRDADREASAGLIPGAPEQAGTEGPARSRPGSRRRPSSRSIAARSRGRASHAPEGGSSSGRSWTISPATIGPR